MKLKIIKKIVKTPCYRCDGSGDYQNKRLNKSVVCKICHGTGKYSETHFYHIFIDKKGNKYCLDGDTAK